MANEPAYHPRWSDRVRTRFGDVVSRQRLRACSSLGARATVGGSPIVRNLGELVIGDDFRLSSAPVRSHLVVLGSLHIGNRVRIEAGAAIACLGAIEIGDDVSIGKIALIFDSNFHETDDFGKMSVPQPIRIERNVRIGHRVAILPGSSIGAGTVVASGSVVSGRVRENAIVEGNPARARVDRDSSDAAAASADRDMARFVMRVLGLPSLPDLGDGPAQIAQWDSLGALRLIVALEETFGVALSEEQIKTARSVRDLANHVERAASP